MNNNWLLSSLMPRVARNHGGHFDTVMTYFWPHAVHGAADHAKGSCNPPWNLLYIFIMWKLDISNTAFCYCCPM